MHETLKQCGKCGVRYPEDLLSPFQSSRGGTLPVCGVCALELSNEIHGVKRERFDGERAEAMRQEALAWREKGAA
jgi:hypothetical protein